MSRFRQIWPALRNRPWEWLGLLLVGVYLAAALALGFGPFGILFALIAWGLFTRLLIASHGRHPLFKITQIGVLEMEVSDFEPVGMLTKSSQKLVYLTAGGLFALLLAAEAGHAIFVFFQGSADWADDLILFAKHLLAGGGYAALIYWSYRNRSLRLLVTNQGLFRVLDPSRPWPTDRAIDDAHSPLRAIKIYGWDQIARYHWSRQPGGPVLHLNVRQNGFSVPQLISYKLPKLSEAAQRQFDELLQRFVDGMAGSMTEGSSHTSVPAPIGSPRSA